MILPTKRLHQDRALLSVGAVVLRALGEPMTVSRLWNEVRTVYQSHATTLTYDWFVLALDLLFCVNAITFADGRIHRISE
jgi:hypothetical protein